MQSKFATASGALVANNLLFLDLVEPANNEQQAPATLRAYFTRTLTDAEAQGVQNFFQTQMQGVGAAAIEATHSSDTYWTQVQMTFKANANFNPADVLLHMQRFVAIQKQEMAKAENAARLVQGVPAEKLTLEIK